MLRPDGRIFERVMSLAEEGTAPNFYSFFRSSSDSNDETSESTELGLMARKEKSISPTSFFTSLYTNPGQQRPTQASSGNMSEDDQKWEFHASRTEEGEPTAPPPQHPP